MTLTQSKAKKDAGDVADTSAQAGTDGRVETASDVDPNAAVNVGTQQAKEKVSGAVPEETKGRAREVTDRTKDYLSRKMPKERREQVTWRLKKMVLEIQGHSDCKSIRSSRGRLCIGIDWIDYRPASYQYPHWSR